MSGQRYESSRYAAQSVFPPGFSQLLHNARATDFKHTPPNPDHYLNAQYLWDTCFHAIVYAQNHNPWLARQELTELMKGQDPETGIIPNMVSFAKGRRMFNPEDWFRMDARHSDYTQPPVIALAAMRTYESFVSSGHQEEGLRFAEGIIPGLEKYYEYFERYRKNIDNNLIGVIHPSETGRDSDPTFDGWVKRIDTDYANVTPVSRTVGYLNTGLDYAGKLIQHDLKNRRDGWNPFLSRKNFWVNDVMFNSMYAENLRNLAELEDMVGQIAKGTVYRNIASLVQNDIENTMWDSAQRRFFAQGMDGPIREISVSNLFPLILDGIGGEKVEAILEMIEDPGQFGTPLPVPSVPADSRKFDPYFIEKRIWRGPVWMNMNWYLVTQGLLKQARRFKAKGDRNLMERCISAANNIAVKSYKAVSISGFWEFYNPMYDLSDWEYRAAKRQEDKLGYRIYDFGWSTLAWGLMDETEKEILDLEGS